VGRVRLERVTKRFGEVIALSELTLDVADHELLVLLGPSGCGKTTALRILAGLERPSEGRVLLDDRDVTDVEAKDRDVAMVFQSYALYPHKTVAQNIAFPLRARRVPRAEQEQLVRDAAAALDLTDLLDRKPRALSGGQRQRVALARAIVRRPAVFLMDEPLSNLDARLRGQTRAELVDLHHRLGATFVYVTHDQVEAMTMGTRVAVLHEGVLEQVGPPQEVYDRPATTFVAGFLGSPPMNLLDGTVHDGAVLAGGAALRLPDDTCPGAGPVRVGVRPEHLHPVPPDHGPALAGTAVAVESLGHERHVTVRLATGEALVVRVGADDPPPVDGDTVRLAVRPEHLHLFSVASGKRLADAAVAGAGSAC